MELQARAQAPRSSQCGRLLFPLATVIVCTRRFTWTPIDKFINQGTGCSQRMHLTPSHNAHATCEPACMFERPRLNVAMHLWHLACAFL